LSVKLGAEFLINTFTIGDQHYPSTISLSGGGFVVTWMSNGQDGSGYGIYGQSFNDTGVRLGSEFQANTYTINNQHCQSAVNLLNGNFLVGWSSQGQNTSAWGVYAQRFTRTGLKVGSEFQLENNVTSCAGILGGLSNGDFIVQLVKNTESQNIYAQMFDGMNATKVGDEFRSNTDTINNKAPSGLANLANDTFVLVWASNLQDGSGWGVYGQRFDVIYRLRIGSEFRVNSYTIGDQSYASAAGFQDGSFVVVWNSFNQGGSDSDVESRIFTPPRLDNNILILNEGQTKIVTGYELSASAPNTLPGILAFTVSNITHGQFEVVSFPGIPLFNFTQQQVTNAQIQFVHDGSEFAPAYNVKVNEVVLDTSFVPATIIFTNINDAPVLIGGSGLFTFTEKSIPLIIDANISLSDVDSFNMTNATIAITNNFASGEDILSFVDQAGVTGIYNATTGQLLLTGSSSVANYRLTLRNVTYSDSSSNPSLLPRTVSFTVNDGALNSNTVTRVIGIIPVNDAPVLIGSGGSITFTEKNAAVAIDPSIILTDVDSINVTSASIAISSNFAGSEDFLGFVDQTGIVGIYITAPTGILSLTGSSSLANYQTALRSVTYLDTSSNPSLAPRIISFTINDGELNSNTVTRTINITPVNDAPILTGSSGTVSFTEKNPALLIDSGIGIFDVEDNLTNATIKFISSVLAEDVLSFTAQGGISGMYSNVTGILSLTGSSSVSNYQLALRSVTYFNPSLNPSAALRTVSFTVNDGEVDSSTVNRSITVTPVNDPPVLAVNTLTITGGQSLNLTPSQLYAADPDTPDNALTFTMNSIQFCRFERVSAPGVGITTFTQQDINTNQIRIVATGGTVSAPAYQVSVSDGQYSTTPASANVNFDGGFVPSISVNKVTITQNGVVILTSSQLNAFDADTPASGLTFTASNIRYGTFSIVGSPTNPITTFTLQSINNGFIQFTQDGSENAPSYDISVSDGTHTTNTQAATITYININQAPVVINAISDRLSEKVDQAFSFQVASNTFFDSDPGDQAALIYSSKMRDGNTWPTWISFDASNRQFTGKPIAAGQTRISVFARDPSNAVGVANFTMDVSAPQSSVVTLPEDHTLQNALISASVSALVGFIAFGLKYGIRRAYNKKLQDVLDTSQTDAEKRQKGYDKEVISPIAKYINVRLKVTAPFESISTDKVTNFVSSVQLLVSKMSSLGIRYQDLKEDDRQIVHTTIIQELKNIVRAKDKNCCAALLRCGFFKADIVPQDIEANAEKIAKAVDAALFFTHNISLIPIPPAPRMSVILRRLVRAEEKAAQAEEKATQLEAKMAAAEAEKQTVQLPRTQTGSPIHTPTPAIVADRSSVEEANIQQPHRVARPAHALPSV
jgi:hypothetical protein